MFSYRVAPKEISVSWRALLFHGSDTKWEWMKWFSVCIQDFTVYVKRVALHCMTVSLFFFNVLSDSWFYVQVYFYRPFERIWMRIFCNQVYFTNKMLEIVSNTIQAYSWKCWHKRSKNQTKIIISDKDHKGIKTLVGL